MAKNELIQEVFTTVLPVPAGWGDPVERVKYQTQGTIGISVEVLLTYGCNEAPKVDKVKIIGFNQVGFIISSEYEVEGYVDSSTIKPCEKSGCRNAIRYEVEIKFFIYLIIGIGFGLGGGTGTLGFRDEAVEETTSFTTKCICCDPPARTGAATTGALS